MAKHPRLVRARVAATQAYVFVWELAVGKTAVLTYHAEGAVAISQTPACFVGQPLRVKVDISPTADVAARYAICLR
jgi:hypothetical protein